MKSAKELRKIQDEFLEKSKTIDCLQKIATNIIEDMVMKMYCMDVVEVVFK